MPDEVTYDLGLDAILRGALFSFSKNNFRFLPPLVIDEGFVDEMVDIFDKALGIDRSAGIGRKARRAKEYLRARFR